MWTSGSLPPGFAAEVVALADVRSMTVVRANNALLVRSWDAAGVPVDAPGEGYVIPLEAMAMDPATYPAFLPPAFAPLFASLGAGEALLGESSARFRGLGPGAVLEFEDGMRLTVRAVVPDDVIGGGEMAVVWSGWSQGALPTPRYLLLHYDGGRSEVEAGIRALLPQVNEPRFRAPGETAMLRYSDGVLSQIQIKDRFGEFSYLALAGGRIQRDARWVGANLATADLPIVGRLRCHRLVITAFAGALDELIARGLDHLVHADTFLGCDSARMIAGSRTLSRHAWGAAIDLDNGNFPLHMVDDMDPRLLEVMDRWGFKSGHTFLFPDAGHFEYVRPSEAERAAATPPRAIP